MTGSTIKALRGRRIWDSRGRPTVEVEVVLDGGAVGRGIAPAGASMGSREAVDLRDQDGFGVSLALDGVAAEIAPRLMGMDARTQTEVDAALVALDGTSIKSRLGGNALIATSMAVLHAAAATAGEPLWRYVAESRPVSIPLPEIQIFGGGAHAGRRVDIQDFLVMPVGAQSFDEALVMTSDVYRAAGTLMADIAPLSGVADEGGWWPCFETNEHALDTLSRAIARAGYDQGEVVISLDVAASEFGKAGDYGPSLEQRRFSTEEWLDLLVRWVRTYPIVSLEDPFAEDDSLGMTEITRQLGGRLQIVGDDYLVTSAALVEEAASRGACNAVLIKPNQAGTITETRAALMAGRDAGWGTIVSARSGETEDVTIAHLAVGWNAGQLKVGSFTRSERMAKWNEVLRIEESVGRASFAGASALPFRGGTA